MADELSEGLQEILNRIQDQPLNTDDSKRIIKVLDRDNSVEPQLIEKLLQICVRDPKDDVTNATRMLNIVSIVINKVIDEKFVSEPDLLPSMTEIIHMLNTSIYNCTSDKMKILYLKLLNSYPDEVYLKLEDDNEILELCNLYIHPQFSLELRLQPFCVLQKYLELLPQERKLKFVRKGINVWLQRLIPNVMTLATVLLYDTETPLATLELIVNEFQHVDYFDNPHWVDILQSIYDENKYTTIMKNLLATGSNYWHRLWIVFIKMLKNQLTKSGSSGSPINSMLPVVEVAFKLDIASRCRAFQCWTVLIDNFATETNEAYIHKRIKLLVIPLYSNNAKNEETCMAKLRTWCHLISLYHHKLNNFAEILLIPFLQFCFGKPATTNKYVQIPGLLTDLTREHCAQAFVTLFRHNNCSCRMLFRFLKSTVIEERSLLASKNELVYSFSVAVKAVANKASKLRQTYNCTWMSFIKLVWDKSDDNAKREFFNKLLEMFGILIQDIDNEILADIVLNDMILPLFQDDGIALQVLKLIDNHDTLMNKIFTIIINSSFDTTHDKNDMNKAVTNIKPVIDLIVENCFHTSIADALLNELIANYKSLVFWTAVTSSICEKKLDVRPDILCNVLRWPLRHMDLFTKAEVSTSLWLTLLDFVHTKMGASSVTEEVFAVFSDTGNINETNESFFFSVAVMLLTQKMTADKGIENEIRLVYDICSKINDFNHTHPVFSKLLDTLLELFKKLLKDTNLNNARLVFMILKLVFTKLLSEFNKNTDVDSMFLSKVEDLLKAVKHLLKLEAYSSLKQVILTEFLEYAQCFGQQQMLKNTVLAILQMFLENADGNNPTDNTIKNIIASLNQDKNSTIPTDKAKFITPDTNKTKKKETSIVNTVLEDGEEFVVVKSNWKFNPKKLTDNQKEKLRRKRDDIPALYQDLSQSQEEFKLSTWRTDSQDTTATTTNSKSNDLTTSEKVSSILKNMPNTDVVPKILKNILTENNEKNKANTELANEHLGKVTLVSSKEVTPRLSLKDRVFRNVKLLIDKSDIQNAEKKASLVEQNMPQLHTSIEMRTNISDSNPASSDINIQQLKSVDDHIVPQLHTPTKMRTNISNSNSAPSDINIDRPSRLKRKPKKFEEMQLFCVKKKCQSPCNSDFHKKDLAENVNPMQLDPPDNIPQNQENERCSNSSVSLLQDNDAQNENILNVDSGILDSNVNVDIQEQKSTSSVVASTPQIDIQINDSVDDSRVSLTDTKQTNNNQVNIIEESSVRNTSSKKTGKRKSRIEKELAIDTVEGHPFLNAQSERSTRNKASESPYISRRKKITQGLNSPKTCQKNTPKRNKKIKDILKRTTLDKSKELDDFSDSQDSSLRSENESQDIIESSQDSAVSIMSAKSSNTLKRIPVVTLQNIKQQTVNVVNNIRSNQSDKSLKKDGRDSVISSGENKDDCQVSPKQTAVDNVDSHLTEKNKETINSNEIMVIDDETRLPAVINLIDTYGDMDTQDLADADTQPTTTNSVTSKSEESNIPAEATKKVETDIPQKDAIDAMSNIDTPKIQEESKSLDDKPKCLDADTFQDRTICSVDSIQPQKEGSCSAAVNKTIEVDKFQEHLIDDISNNDPSSIQTQEKSTSLIEETQSLDVDKLQHAIYPTSNIETLIIETQAEKTKAVTESDILDANKCQEQSTESISNDDTLTIKTQEVRTRPSDKTKSLDTDKLRVSEVDSVSNVDTLTSEIQKERPDQTKSVESDKLQENAINSTCNMDTLPVQTQEESTRSLTESLLCATETKQDESLSKLSSKDEEQRKRDFLSNTLEISPIKNLSPVRENESSPETTDYVVIQLSSPVQSNGDRFEKCDSPEFFTDDKVSPDKRDQSPSREETRVVTASPRSLSLKKNKPQVRCGGRAAQMLGLCVPGPDRLQTLINSEKSIEAEEPKKSSPFNSSARRNLRILYNSTNESSDTSDVNEESPNFLKMKRDLPAIDSSPSVPILKRKLDVVDDANVSPANKRKRVSFHDPPVSTTVCVKKYIESSNVRSPQSTAAKRQDRLTRSQVCANLESKKCLDTVFKLDTALTKAVESFTDNDVTPLATDTEMSSLEPTPLVEVIKNSELNDIDPICLDLINCKDPIDNIASELSSSAMRPLLVKEFAGKIETVGDLAKMSELEVNRLCIKAPKVQVVKKVLMQYAKKVKTIANEMTPTTEAAFSETTVLESKAADVEMQTDCVVIGDVESTSEALVTSVASIQTDGVSTIDCNVQTDESSITSSTADIAVSLLEKPDFCEHLNELLDVPSKQSICKTMPQSVLIDMILQGSSFNSFNEIIDRLVEKEKNRSDSLNGRHDNPKLSFLLDYLSERFSSKDLILFCSDLLKKLHDGNV